MNSGELRQYTEKGTILLEHFKFKFHVTTRVQKWTIIVCKPAAGFTVEAQGNGMGPWILHNGIGVLEEIEIYTGTVKG